MESVSKSELAGRLFCLDRALGDALPLLRELGVPLRVILRDLDGQLGLLDGQLGTAS